MSYLSFVSMNCFCFCRQRNNNFECIKMQRSLWAVLFKKSIHVILFVCKLLNVCMQMCVYSKKKIENKRNYEVENDHVFSLKHFISCTQNQVMLCTKKHTKKKLVVKNCTKLQVSFFYFNFDFKLFFVSCVNKKKKKLFRQSKVFHWTVLRCFLMCHTGDLFELLSYCF